MDGTIRALSDNDAIRILSRIAKHRLGATEMEAELPVGLGDALRNEFDVSATGAPISDGDMARHALLLLAQDPEMENVIATMAENPERAQKLGPITAIVLTAAVVAALKTSVRYKRLSNGEWELEIDSPSLDKESLKGFVDKLLSWIPKGPFG